MDPGPGFYTKQPVTVEAMQFTAETWQQLNSWLAAELGAEKFYFLVSGDTISLHIQTPEGDRDCPPGYWIVKGTEGEFYPVSPEVFAKVYRKSVTVPMPLRVGGKRRPPLYGAAD